MYCVTIGFGFSSDWLRKWREILSYSQGVVMQNETSREFTFDIHLKTALNYQRHHQQQNQLQQTVVTLYHFL